MMGGALQYEFIQQSTSRQEFLGNEGATCTPWTQGRQSVR